MGKMTSKGANTWSRSVDSKGRLTLGEAYANRAVIVEERQDGELLIKPARVIPETELRELYGVLAGPAPAATKSKERKAAKASRVKKNTKPVR